MASIVEKEGADVWFLWPEEQLLPPGTKCPKCGGEMVVVAIFSEPEKKLRTIGMPLLPGMGGQVGILRLLFYHLVDTFSPFKVAFRWVKRRFESLGGDGGEKKEEEF
mgnify:CR=1 FL=1